MSEKNTNTASAAPETPVQAAQAAAASANAPAAQAAETPAESAPPAADGSAAPANGKPKAPAKKRTRRKSTKKSAAKPAPAAAGEKPSKQEEPAKTEQPKEPAPKAETAPAPAEPAKAEAKSEAPKAEETQAEVQPQAEDTAQEDTKPQAEVAAKAEDAPSKAPSVPAEEPAPEETPAKDTSAGDSTAPDTPAEKAEPAPDSAEDKPAADFPAEAPAETPADTTAVPENPAKTEPAQTDTAPAAEPPADSADSAEPPGEDYRTEEADELADDTEELPPIDEKRLLDMTRTVQLSVEQIMSNVEEQSGDAAPDADADTGDEDTEDSPDTVSDAVRSGFSGMAKWLLLVAVFIVVVAGFGIAYLYRSATPDMLPNIRVTFGDQVLEPSAYKWHVPVVGNWFKRTYAETYSSAPTALEKPIAELSPDINVSPSDYATKLTITDADKNTVFDGTASEFQSFCFTANGTYNAKLVASATASRAAGSADITGSETWLFNFEIEIEPSVYLSETSVQQGRVAAVRVTGSYADATPTLTSTLDNQGFIETSNGWVCYLPIPWNAPLGTETIDVQVGTYTTTLNLKITDGSWSYKDYSSNSQRAAPYIGQDDVPAKVKALFTAAPTATIAWADAGFVQPFLNRLDTKLLFGATEYVGRSYSQRGTNTGAGGRTSTNVIANTQRGELVIAPASGTVALAADLGGDYGNTLVLDHGAGVRTIFYGLDELNVKAGQQIKQGQTLASCGKTTVIEMRIGSVPIDPVAVWRGQCNGLKYY